ncbi:MAG TPA: hypothetical protein PKZ43_08840 [Bacteroidales bacterium]|nr:hypothetical protein [Bacteroidales bacterium]
MLNMFLKRIIKIALCLFFLLGLAEISFPQINIQYSEKKDDSYRFQYNESPIEKEKNTQIIFENISNTAEKNIKSAEYLFLYNYRIRISNNGKISKNNEKIYSVFIEIQSIKCTGDVVYRDFNISHLLSPSTFDADLLVEDKKNNTLKPIHIEGLEIKNYFGERNIEFEYTSTDSIKNISLKNKLFYYNDSITNAIKNYLSTVDAYYKSIPIINTAYDKLSTIKIENTEIVKVYDIDLKEVEALITELNAKNFKTKLKLSEKDPLNYVSKLEELTNKTKSLRLLMNQTLNNLDHVFYDKGKEFLEKNDTTAAIKNLEKATVVNPESVKSFYLLAKTYFEIKEYDKACRPVTIITTKLKPDNTTLRQTIKLGYDILACYVNKAESLIKKEIYHDALDILQQANLFCDSTPVIICSDVIQKNIIKAKNGIYQSFIIISDKAVDKNILHIGEIYTIKAKEYQHLNKLEIPSSADADVLLSKLVNKMTDAGLKLNSEQQYDTALILLKKAYDICKKYPEINCNEKVLSQIANSKKGIFQSLIKNAEFSILQNNPVKADSLLNEAILYQKDNQSDISDAKAIDSLVLLMKKYWYEKDIRDGINCLYNKDGITALACFNKAKQVELDFSLTKNLKLDSLISLSAKPLILNYIEKAGVKTWGNELEKAQHLSDTASFLQKKFCLQNDTIINSAIVDLNAKIKNQKCKNAKSAFDDAYKVAFIHLSQKRYASADYYFNKCIYYIDNNADCGISDSIILLNKNKYLKAANYQKKILASDSLIAIAKYYDAIEKYIESEKYYTINDMSVFNISPLSFKDYVLKTNNNSFTYSCSNYYLDRGEYQNTLVYLNILLEKGYTQKLTMGIQESLAIKLSQIDILKNSKQNPSVLIDQYTGNDVWYAYFKTAYLKNWKLLQKSIRK